MIEMQKEDTLEEMWRIKRAIGAQYPTWEAYVAGILAFQEEERKRGVKFVSPAYYAPSSENGDTATFSVAEPSAAYDAKPPQI